MSEMNESRYQELYKEFKKQGGGNAFAEWLADTKIVQLEAENERLREGNQFTDARGKEYLVRIWGDGLWLFYKHPDGQWVSLKKIVFDIDAII